MENSPPFVRIVTASAEDIPLLSELANRIWPEVYAGMISQEQIRYMLDALYNPEALKKQMEEQNQVFLLLLADDKPAGFASYTTDAEVGLTKLNKLYLLPEVQGFGLGKLLIDYVEAAAGQNGSSAIFLNVNRENPALTFYERCGYRIASKEDIPIGPFFMNDYVMRKPLA